MSMPDTQSRLASLGELDIRRMRSRDLAAVTKILVLSFSGKMDAATPGQPGVAAQLFARVALAGGDAWVADGEGVIGLVTLQDRKRPWYARAEWPHVRAVRPLRRCLRAMLYLLVFHSAEFPATELYVETMAVHPAVRGRGVGSALLRFADAEALRRGRTSVSLYCVRENVRARALYVRRGYRIVRSEDLWWCSRLLGFRFTDQMRRDLPGVVRVQPAATSLSKKRISPRRDSRPTDV